MRRSGRRPIVASITTTSKADAEREAVQHACPAEPDVDRGRRDRTDDEQAIVEAWVAEHQPDRHDRRPDEPQQHPSPALRSAHEQPAALRALGQLGPIDGLDRVDLGGREVEMASVAA